MEKNTETPILSKYLKLYQDQPNSLAFAPLAEAYRKIGDYEKAFAILKKGLREHPHYAFGYYILSNCYFDKKEYSLAYTTLKPFAFQYRDNLKFQELFAEICLKLDEKIEALEALKNVLFLVPKNKIAQKKVHELEESMEVFSNPKDRSATESANSAWNFKVNETASDENVDSWVQVNLSLANNSESNDGDEYTSVKIKETVSPSMPVQSKSERDLLITHTLVDLYISQGHKDRAIEILNKILALDPKDAKSLARLEQLKNESSEGDYSSVDQVDEVLTFSLDNNQLANSHEPSGRLIERIEQRFELFLELIREKKETKKHPSH